MAIPVFSDGSSPEISPRISFSHDLPQSDAVPVEECVRTSSSSSSVDFDFCVFRQSMDLESSSADELFSDGKILPVQIKQRLTPSRRSESTPDAPPRLPPQVLPRPYPPLQKSKNSRAVVDQRKIRESEEKHKSFWWSKRSSRLNCIGGGRTLCPFPFLSTSNLAGSSVNDGGNGKHSPPISNNQRPNFLRSNSFNSWQRQPNSAAACSSGPPPLKRSNSHGYYNSNNRINFNPVLNLPPATANLFGLISIFSMGKDRRSKKKH